MMNLTGRQELLFNFKYNIGGILVVNGKNKPNSQTKFGSHTLIDCMQPELCL